MVVLDASVTIAWALKDENWVYADQVQDQVAAHGAITPAIWPLEVTNAMLTAERRGRIKPAETLQVFSLLFRLNISVETEQARILILETIELARLYRLSAYDAAYLHQAMRHGYPLATIDGALRQAAALAGVPLFGHK